MAIPACVEIGDMGRDQFSFPYGEGGLSAKDIVVKLKEGFRSFGKLTEYRTEMGGVGERWEMLAQRLTRAFPFQILQTWSSSAGWP